MATNRLKHSAMELKSTVEVVPLSIHTGAEIHGVDLTQPIPREQIRAIRDALLAWKVVFFRGQELTHQQQVEFSRQFGETTPGHVVYGSNDAVPQIYAISKHRTANSFSSQLLRRPWTGWHTDITAAINPPMASILRADIVPPYGGDTQFTNLVAAYEALSPSMQSFVDGLHGIHSNAPPTNVTTTKAYDDSIRKRLLRSRHPIVRVHPETGERALYVSPSHLREIDGLTPRESQVLLEFLWEHIVRSEFTVRFKWEPGSVAFWDNRATCHLAPRDIFDSEFDREFYRTTLLGDVPIGVDGNESTGLDGDPIEAL